MEPLANKLDYEEISVRFRRGDKWHPAFVRSLSTTAMCVETSCPPRSGELVGVELSSPRFQLCVDVAVLASTRPGCEKGVEQYGFSGRFMTRGDETQHYLAALSSLRHGETVSFDVRTQRRHPRFPVRWPIVMGKNSSGPLVLALDVSRGGLFVHSMDVPSDNAVIELSIPLDRSDHWIKAQARVVRTVSRFDGLARGTDQGFGLELLDLSGDDTDLYSGLVSRIATRTGLQLLLSSSAPNRIGAMLLPLQAAGYAVRCATSPDLLVELSRSCEFDLVVVDRCGRKEQHALDELYELGFAASQILMVEESSLPSLRPLVDKALNL